MSPKFFTVLLLLIALQTIGSSASVVRRKWNQIGEDVRGRLNKYFHDIYADVTRYNSIYYDPKTGVGLKAELEDLGRHPLATKIAFRGLPCSCEGLQCTCCAGVNITSVKFNRMVCAKFAYVSDELAVKLMITMNDKEIFSNKFSAQNPPPLCAPFPYLPFITFCVRFYDIHTVDKNVQACIDFETRIIGSPILILHFNCVKMGLDGISWSRPGEVPQHIEGVPSENVATEVYDEVDFEQQDLEVYANYTSTLSPEEELQIGQLKL